MCQKYAIENSYENWYIEQWMLIVSSRCTWLKGNEKSRVSMVNCNALLQKSCGPCWCFLLFSCRRCSVWPFTITSLSSIRCFLFRICRASSHMRMTFGRWLLPGRPRRRPQLSRGILTCRMLILKTLKDRLRKTPYDTAMAGQNFVHGFTADQLKKVDIKIIRRYFTHAVKTFPPYSNMSQTFTNFLLTCHIWRK